MTMTTMRRRIAATAAALLSVALVLTGCGNGNDSPEGSDNSGSPANTTHTVKADNGTVQVPTDPQRIVTLGNASLPFIEMGGKPVGVTELPVDWVNNMSAEQQATYKAATDLGNSQGWDLEKLASLKPDLIMVNGTDTKFDPIKKQLASIAPVVFWGLDTEWKTIVDQLAEAGNVTDAFSRQKAEFAKLVTKMKTEYSGIIENDKFVAVDRGSWNDPGTFYIADTGCVEIAMDDLGMDFAKAADGEAPLSNTNLPFEQLAKLSKYDVILYPVDKNEKVTESFAPVIETNTWKELPNVKSGHTLGVHCSSNSTYGDALQYLDSLNTALASLKAKG